MCSTRHLLSSSAPAPHRPEPRACFRGGRGGARAGRLASIARLWLLGALLFAGGAARAQEGSDAESHVAQYLRLPNLPMLTAGGMQVWADEWFFHDLRIQRNVLTGHCRLLDGDNRRLAWGEFEACKAHIDEIRAAEKLPPMKGKAVIVLHGLFRTRNSMAGLCDALEKDGKYEVFAVGYPTTRGSVADHAETLDSVVRSLEGLEEINFVGHSLGNLVVRRWLSDFAEGRKTLPEGQRLGRIVMLGPPNHQPQIAARLLANKVATAIAGPAAEQLAVDWSDLEPRLATPCCEFGILAGGKGDSDGYNPLLPGDDDGVVTVEGTRLAGATDFRCLPVLHSFMMNDPQVQKLTLRFLTDGCFEAPDRRAPIVDSSREGPTSLSP